MEITSSGMKVEFSQPNNKFQFLKAYGLQSPCICPPIRPRMKYYSFKFLVLTAIGLMVATQLRAANFTTSTAQSSGSDWTAPIWQGTSPSVGNAYEVLNTGLIR